ncbi:MAG: cytochrome c maturation protein CcmE [Pseudonocardiaceae bacterium]
MRSYRLLVVAGLGVAAVLLGLLFFGNLNRNLVYYLTPAEAVAQRADFGAGQRLQIGGFVVPGSVVRTAEGLRFTVAAGTAPGAATVAVRHTGAPAQLFRAGIGVVLEGSWRGDLFVSDTMLVKHDANYRPPGKQTAAAG